MDKNTIDQLKEMIVEVSEEHDAPKSVHEIVIRSAERAAEMVNKAVDMGNQQVERAARGEPTLGIRFTDLMTEKDRADIEACIEFLMVLDLYNGWSQMMMGSETEAIMDETGSILIDLMTEYDETQAKQV